MSPAEEVDTLHTHDWQLPQQEQQAKQGIIQ